MQLNGSNAGAKAYFTTIKMGVAELGEKILGFGKAIISALGSVAVMAVVSALISGIIKLTKAYENLQEQNAENAKAIKETVDALKSSNDEFTNIMSQYADLIVNTEDLASAQSQLIDVQKQLQEPK